MFVTAGSRSGRISARLPSGTLALFQQTTAPLGWTKQTTHNDKALRVVSGTCINGGSQAFSSTLSSTLTSGATTVPGSTDATTITTSTLPAHSHVIIAGVVAAGTGGASIPNLADSGTNVGTQNTGSGGSHTHGLTGTSHTHTVAVNVAFVDLIIARKN